jgi:CBS domain-containing protein
MADSRKRPNLVARALMVTQYATLEVDRPLREAMAELVRLQSNPKCPNALIVVAPDGEYEGVLTARLLFRSLLALWTPSREVREDAGRHHRELLALIQERSSLTVRSALLRGLPTAAPEDGLLTLIERGCEQKMEVLPVIEEGRPVGVIPITRLFHAVASLALTPEDEGIHLGRNGN